MSNIEKFGSFDGIEMGVMSDGTPFLTGRGLAKLCDVTPTAIFSWGQKVNSDTPRWRKMSYLLSDRGFYEDNIYTVLDDHPQQPNAYPEDVCMSFLEYYGWEADDVNRKDKAKTLFRQLAKRTFRDFVYTLVGYNTQQLTFSDYMLSRITHHHDIDHYGDKAKPLPDGYFCLFDKMIELLQKFDLAIGYQLGETWYDTRKEDERFLEPDISLGRHFSELFQRDYNAFYQDYLDEYNHRLQTWKRGSFWTKKLREKKWKADRACIERDLRIKHINIPQVDSSLPIPLEYIDYEQYHFKPSPDSTRSNYLRPAYCYSNSYTSLFYDWLREVFFKFVWKDYILERDPNGWWNRYNQFCSFDQQKRNRILKTAEGKMIIGFEFPEQWRKQLPESPDNQ